MGVISSRIRRHRRTRLAAEMACTWTPRRLFPLGTEQGGVYYPDDPNSLLRRRNRLTYTQDFSNAVWLKARCTASPPSGGFTTVTEDASVSASHYWYRAAEAAPVGTYGVYTIRVKKSVTRNFALWFGSNSSNPIDGFRRGINLSTGALMAPIIDGSGVVEVSTVVTEHDATTWLVTCVMQIATGGTAFGILHCLVNGLVTGNIFYTGDGTSSIQAGYAQLETYTTTPSAYQAVTDWNTEYMAAVGHLVTQFTDSTGTTPVTKVTDPVGFTMDRRFGGYRGPELCPYASGFSSTSGITVASATVALNGSTLEVTSTGAAGNNYAVVPAATGLTTGDTFEVAVRAKRGAQGTQQGIAVFTFASITARTVTNSGSYVTYSWRVVATATSGSMRIMAADAAGAVGDMLSVESISIRKIPGNHRIQATSGSRKTLSARYNLLTKTEQFDDAAWAKTNATISANVDGTLDKLIPNAASTDARCIQAVSGRIAGETLVYTVTGKYLTGSFTDMRVYMDDGASNIVSVAINVQTGAVTTAAGTSGTWTGASAAVVASSDGGYTVTLRVTTAGAAASRAMVWCRSTGNGTDGIAVGRADLRTADDAAKAIPAYQRVNTATDYGTDGFPHYWLYDGTDDSDATASTVDGSASDKVTVIAGIAKLSDAAAACVIEHTATSASNNGSFILSAPTSAAVYQWRSKGTALSDAATTSSYPAPHSGVLTGVGDIANDTSALRIGGAQVATAATDQGTGTYANATTYFGRRGASLLPFNGREYAIIERFGPMSDSERNQAERWVANRMGVTI